MAHGLRKKPLDFGGNPDQVSVRVGSAWRLGGGRDRSREVLRTDRVCNPAFNSNNFATLAALAEVCVLLSVVLIQSRFGPCDPDVPDVFQDWTYPTSDCGCLLCAVAAANASAAQLYWWNRWRRVRVERC